MPGVWIVVVVAAGGEVRSPYYVHVLYCTVLYCTDLQCAGLDTVRCFPAVEADISRMERARLVWHSDN